MVSTLSARLLGLSESTQSKKGSLSPTLENSQTDYSPSHATGSSAPPQQQGSVASPPPGVIDLLSRSYKNKESPRFRSNAKRRKIEELNLLASSAKADIARGGLHMPVVRMNNPRMLPVNIDMSSVDLVTSSELRSPFLCEALELPLFDAKEYYNKEAARTFSELFSSCKDLYKNTDASKIDSPISNEDSESTTSSVTNGEEDSEDAIILKRSDGSLISIVDALAISQQPRIVVLACSPWTVIHVNAAFMRLTNKPSSKMLGHTVEDLLGCSVPTEGSGHPLTRLSATEIPLKISDEKEVSCRVSVTAVGTDTNSITHMALGLSPSEPVDSFESGEDMSLGFSLRVAA